jgi:hypothetical protein
MRANAFPCHRRVRLIVFEAVSSCGESVVGGYGASAEPGRELNAAVLRHHELKGSVETETSPLFHHAVSGRCRPSLACLAKLSLPSRTTATALETVTSRFRVAKWLHPRNRARQWLYLSTRVCLDGLLAAAVLPAPRRKTLRPMKHRCQRRKVQHWRLEQGLGTL